MVADAPTGPGLPASWRDNLVLMLDKRLRKWEHIREYSHHPECIFRIHVGESRESVRLATGDRLHAGDLLIHLHLWNEHMPPIGIGGPSVRWAQRLQRQLRFSLRELANCLAERSEFGSVQAIRGEMIVASPQQTEPFARIVRHLGFAVVAEACCPSIPERLRRFGENMLAFLIVSTINPGARHGGVLHRGRVVMYMSRRTLERLYGNRPSRRADLRPRSGSG